MFAALVRTLASAIERLGETPPPRRLRRNLPMSYREDFANYIALRNRANSRKAPSFFLALYLLSVIASVTPMEGCSDFWYVDSPQTIRRLYNFALSNQTKEQEVFLRGDIPRSYGQKRFYSATLRAKVDLPLP